MLLLAQSPLRISLREAVWLICCCAHARRSLCICGNKHRKETKYKRRSIIVGAVFLEKNSVPVQVLKYKAISQSDLALVNQKLVGSVFRILEKEDRHIPGNEEIK